MMHESLSQNVLGLLYAELHHNAFNSYGYKEKMLQAWC